MATAATSSSNPRRLELTSMANSSSLATGELFLPGHRLTLEIAAAKLILRSSTNGWHSTCR